VNGYLKLGVEGRRRLPQVSTKLDTKGRKRPTHKAPRAAPRKADPVKAKESAEHPATPAEHAALRPMASLEDLESATDQSPGEFLAALPDDERAHVRRLASTIGCWLQKIAVMAAAKVAADRIDSAQRDGGLQ
jgi:hypothetical protein